MNDLNERLARMSPERRSYTLMNLPAHLDAAGRNPTTIAQLIDLPHHGFVQNKIEWTHDVPDAGRDYKYFFRAHLQNEDLGGALWLAKSRVGLSFMSDWFTSKAFPPLLRYIGSQSALWIMIKRTLIAVEPLHERVDCLADFCQQGLEPAIYNWLRDQFDYVRQQVDETRQRAFYQAIATSQKGAINYVLSGAVLVGSDEALITAIIEHFESLCHGSEFSVEQANREIATLATIDVDTFVAAIDAFRKTTNRVIALSGLNALEIALHDLKPAPDVIRCSAALSHAFAVHENLSKAEALLQRCLDEVPHAFEGEYFEEFYLEDRVDASIRQAMAAAPFPALWPRAISDARAIMTSVHGRANRVELLAGYLQITPYITSTTQRMDWLNQILAEIQDIVKECPNNESLDITDYALNFKALLGGKDPHKDPHIQLVETLVKAFINVFSDIDRVLSDDEDLKPLQDLLMTAATIKVSIAGQDLAKNIPFFKEVIPTLARSTNPMVVRLVIDIYIQIVNKARLLSDETGDVLVSALIALAANDNCKVLEDLLRDIFDEVEQTWCQKDKRVFAILFVGLLRAATEAKRPELLDAFSGRILYWHRQIEPKYQDMLTIRWAASLIALGHRDKGERMLRYVRLHQTGNADGVTLTTTMRLMLADVMADVGAKEDIVSLLKDVLVDHINLANSDHTKDALSIAKRLVRDAGDVDARAIFLATARQYREGVDQWKEDVVELLLNNFYAISDQKLTQQLLNTAEKELMHETREDSDMAARWYVMLALSSIGNIETTTEIWRQLIDWKKQRTISGIRACILAIADDTAMGGVRRQALLKDLAQRLNIIPIQENDSLRDALQMIVRLVAIVPSDFIPEVLKLIIGDARKLVSRPYELERFLDALCERLAVINDEVIVSQALIDIFDILDGRDDSGQIELMQYIRLETILDLVKKQTDPKRLRFLLEHVIQCATQKSDERRKANNIAEVVKYGMLHLPLSDSQELLHLGIQLREKIKDVEARRTLLVSMSQAAIKSCSVNEVELVINTLIDEIDEDHFNQWVVALSVIYKDIVTEGIAPALAEKIERQIRTLGVPTGTASQARWTSNLIRTPIESIALPVAHELLNNLDRFADGLDDIRSLRFFLEGIIPMCSSDEIKEFFKSLAEWAACMQNIHNEDCRHLAFIDIMEASATIKPSERDVVQLMVLNQAFAKLSKHGRSTFAGAFERFDMNVEVAVQAIDLNLQAAASHRDRTITSSQVDCLRNSIIQNLEYSYATANEQVIDAFCMQLDMHTNKPYSVERLKLARLASECEHPGLRCRLDAILCDCYENLYLTDIEKWDLYYLASMSKVWWIERSTNIEIARIDRQELLEWVEFCVRNSPDLVTTAIMLSSEWISRENPDELFDFWFDVATSAEAIPTEIRQVLGKAIGTI